MKNLFKNVLKIFLISVFVVAIEIIFSESLSFASDLLKNVSYTFLLLLPIGGVLIILLKKICSKKEKYAPLVLLPFLFLASLISHIFGASVGKEGVAVQLGATVSNYINEKINFIFDKNEKVVHKDNELTEYEESSYFTMAGFAGGFAAVFLTPISAIFYAIENASKGYKEMKHRIIYIMPTILVATFAYYVSKQFLGEKEKYYVENVKNIDLQFAFKIAVVIVITILAVYLFKFLIRTVSQYYNKVKINEIIKNVIISMIVGYVLWIFKGRYSGTGSNLISNIFKDGTYYDYDFILKIIFTSICLGIGYKGGEVMPIFSIGATLGALLSSVLGLPIGYTAMVGFISAFGIGTRTTLTAFFIGFEVFGKNHIVTYGIIAIALFVVRIIEDKIRRL